VMRTGDDEVALQLLTEARATDSLVRELSDAAEEGLDVVGSSPFRLGQRGDLRRLDDLVEPLDRALRSTRVLVRQTAIVAYHQLSLPPTYADFCADLAATTDLVAAALTTERTAEGARPQLIALAERSSRLTRSDELAGEAVLSQLRSIIADLLVVTGLSSLDASDLIPAPRPRG
ncbi:MAG: hypothetical protein WAW88_09175, partial [Nocardioides sp.]